ncbi:hypothetical protein LSH36_3289g00004 [Paralvinella palmiformis]|uniref:Uncharacterized protein n=1 Tax=Paralvinella palmiformis TaxID=53620 RepID=A0AAD9MMV6_9ANNE|nr:hypothetical protein LSH36_3289g00004 [Paralvinella palmiformis]
MNERSLSDERKLSPNEVLDAANKEMAALQLPDPVPTKPSKWNLFSHGCSIFTLSCCCWYACISSLCGLIGLVLSISSYTDYKSGNYDQSKTKKACAIGFTVAGIILGLGTLVAVAYVGYTQGPDWKDLAMTMISEQIDKFVAPYIEEIKKSIPTMPPRSIT